MSKSLPLGCAAVLAVSVLFAGPALDCLADTSAAERRIEEALSHPTELEFFEQPLGDVVDFLKEFHSIDIAIDKKALKKVGVDGDTPITKNLTGISLESALELTLRDYDLTWTVRHEVLLITTAEAEESSLITKVYPVGDLVAGSEPGRRVAGVDPLINVITTTVAPRSWDGAGGVGAIGPLENIDVLVIAQTYKVHRQIAGLLGQLRAITRIKADSGQQAEGGRQQAEGRRTPRTRRQK